MWSTVPALCVALFGLAEVVQPGVPAMRFQKHRHNFNEYNTNADKTRDDLHLLDKIDARKPREETQHVTTTSDDKFKKLDVLGYAAPKIDWKELGEARTKVMADPEWPVRDNLYTAPLDARINVGKKLGSGGFGVAHYGSAQGQAVVVKRFPKPMSVQGNFVTWGDYLAAKSAMAKETRHSPPYMRARELVSSIDGARDECQWATYLQQFGVKHDNPGRLLFMRCFETNIADYHQAMVTCQHDHCRPSKDHELYMVVSFGGQPLHKVDIESFPKMSGLLLQLNAALQYMTDAGVVHHDLKADNVLYDDRTETVSVIDFGAMVSARASKSEYMGTAYTSGFAPEEFETLNPNLRYLPAFDTWSMACVFGEVLVGAAPTQQGKWNNGRETNFSTIYTELFGSTQGTTPLKDAMRSHVRKLLLKQRAKMLDSVEAAYPDFMDNWAKMFRKDPKQRMQGGVEMMAMFLDAGI